MTRLHGQAMGTTWSVSLPLPHGTNADELHRGIQSTLDVLDGQRSTDKPQSALSRFSRADPGTCSDCRRSSLRSCSTR